MECEVARKSNRQVGTSSRHDELSGTDRAAQVSGQRYSWDASKRDQTKIIICRLYSAIGSGTMFLI